MAVILSVPATEECSRSRLTTVMFDYHGDKAAKSVNVPTTLESFLQFGLLPSQSMTERVIFNRAALIRNNLKTDVM